MNDAHECVKWGEDIAGQWLPGLTGSLSKMQIHPNWDIKVKKKKTKTSSPRLVLAGIHTISDLWDRNAQRRFFLLSN